jgi:hypothetical protein
MCEAGDVYYVALGKWIGTVRAVGDKFCTILWASPTGVMSVNANQTVHGVLTGFRTGEWVKVR